MTKSVSVWIYITCLCCLLQPVCTGIIYTSKVCYGSGRHCIQHGINCSDTQKIAIVDAYYTNNTECGQTGLANCHTVNPDSVTERGYHRFSINEVFSLYKNCSRKPQCRYRAPRRVDAYTFSVVKYRCIENDASLNISGSSAEGLSQVSLFNTVGAMANSTIQNNTYVCSFKSDDPTTIVSVYSLDVRIRRRTPGQCLSQFTVLPANYITVNNCSTVFHPFERLNVTAKLPISIYLAIPSVSSTLIWLLINASDPFDVRCQPVTSTGGFTTESTNDRSPAATPQQISGEITTLPNKDVLPISRLPPGVFMGGVAAGAVIVILVGLAVYVLVIRRRYDLTPKKQRDTPASVDHPTYSGLSAGAAVNNSTSIEQISRRYYTWINNYSGLPKHLIYLFH
ncbi:uncharacterized protein LOC124273454 isoform X5 [Haliotis rubra]|uniref:uncharacterized protein LOC124273454 isoform X5 n=1 Tax=Haliotis rubra TaxID=36100 RepID=UPI001EE51ACB|nr:uncharacterized protein LOC124273454 isoform X5 [Haliotis rubra]